MSTAHRVTPLAINRRTGVSTPLAPPTTDIAWAQGLAVATALRGGRRMIPAIAHLSVDTGQPWNYEPGWLEYLEEPRPCPELTEPERCVARLRMEARARLIEDAGGYYAARRQYPIEIRGQG